MTRKVVGIRKSTPEKQLAAWLFLAWLTGPEPQSRLAEVSGMIPVRRSAAEVLNALGAGHPRYAEMLRVVLRSRIEVRPPLYGCSEIDALLSRAFGSILGGAQIRSTLRELKRRAAEIQDRSSQ